MVSIEHVGEVVKQKDGKQIVNNIGEPCCYFSVGFAAPFHKVRLRNLWGRIMDDGSVIWDRLSPQKAEELRKRGIDLESAYGVRLVARDIEPFIPEGLENEITAARLVVFPDETEQQALRRLYGQDAQFKTARPQLDESGRAREVAGSIAALEVNGVL